MDILRKLIMSIIIVILFCALTGGCGIVDDTKNHIKQNLLSEKSYEETEESSDVDEGGDIEATESIVTYEEDALFKWGVIPARSGENNRYGYLTENGIWRIGPEFEKAEEFSKGKTAFVKEYGKSTYSVIDLDGNTLLDGINEILTPFGENGVAFVETEERVFLVSNDGKLEVIPAKDLGVGEIISYNNYTLSGYGIIKCEASEKEGLLGEDLSIILDPADSSFEYIEEVSEGYFWACETYDCWTESGCDFTLIIPDGSLEPVGTLNVPITWIEWSNGYGMKFSGSQKSKVSDKLYDSDYEVIDIHGNIIRNIHMDRYSNPDSRYCSNNGWFRVSYGPEIGSDIWVNYINTEGEYLFSESIHTSKERIQGWISNGIYVGIADVIVDEYESPIGVCGIGDVGSYSLEANIDKYRDIDIVMDLDRNILYYPRQKGFNMKSQFYSDGYAIAKASGTGEIDATLIIVDFDGNICTGEGLDLTAICETTE